jgi:putative ABC transport system permease protein
MLHSDLVYAVRSLRKSPLFTIAVLATVALAIGASTAIFSVVESVLVRPLPFVEPDRLVWVAEKNDKLNLPTFTTSALNYLSWKEETRSLDPLGAIGSTA